MLRLALGLALLVGCNDTPSPQKEGDGGQLCRDHADCAAGEICIHNYCVTEPTGGDPAPAPASLSAAPTELDFGAVTPGEERRLSVVVSNDGERVVTVDRAWIDPTEAPYRLEPMGHGPFWIRAGSGRAIFVSYAPVAAGTHPAELVLESAAPTVRVTLTGR